MAELLTREVKKPLTKRERFIKIVERRVNRIVDYLDLLGNCSNRKNYEYTDADVRKIFNEIEKKLRDVKLQFQEAPKAKKVFRLEE